MKQAPRFPQGKAIANFNIPASRIYDMRPDSADKIEWATEQGREALRLSEGHSWEIKVTNFDANPATMKSWLKRAIKVMYPDGYKTLAFQFRGSRRSGSLYVSVVHGKLNRKVQRKGEEITQRV